MVAQATFNAQERRAEDWRALFELADKRFKFEGVSTQPGAKLALVKAVWQE